MLCEKNAHFSVCALFFGIVHSLVQTHKHNMLNRTNWRRTGYVGMLVVYVCSNDIIAGHVVTRCVEMILTELCKTLLQCGILLSKHTEMLSLWIHCLHILLLYILITSYCVYSMRLLNFYFQTMAMFYNKWLIFFTLLQYPKWHISMNHAVAYSSLHFVWILPIHIYWTSIFCIEWLMTSVRKKQLKNVIGKRKKESRNILKGINN